MKMISAAIAGIAVCVVFIVLALVMIPEETLTGKSLAVARGTLTAFGCALGFAVFVAASGLGDRMRPREAEKPPLNYDEWKKY